MRFNYAPKTIGPARACRFRERVANEELRKFVCSILLYHSSSWYHLLGLAVVAVGIMERGDGECNTNI